MLHCVSGNTSQSQLHDNIWNKINTYDFGTEIRSRMYTKCLFYLLPIKELSMAELVILYDILKLINMLKYCGMVTFFFVLFIEYLHNLVGIWVFNFSVSFYICCFIYIINCMITSIIYN